MVTTKRLAGLSASVLFGLGSAVGISACSDEDGDGGTTDEEIEDIEDTGDSIADEVDEEVDAQEEGTNEDNE
jgi:hypothetical protein